MLYQLGLTGDHSWDKVVEQINSVTNIKELLNCFMENCMFFCIEG